MRLAFMGTPDFAVPVLEALLQGGHKVLRVYSQPPRRAGRGKEPRPSPVHLLAQERRIEVATPDRFRDPDVISDLAALDLDAAVVVAYGQILPQAALDAPRLGCFNVHASLLPRWRGAAPIQRAIMAGDTETGVAIMRMEAGLDTGPVLLTKRVAIGPDETAGLLHDRLSALGAKAMVEALIGIEAGTLAAQPQAADGVTYAAKVEKAEARIDWSLPAEELSNRIRGLSPFPGAWFQTAEDRVKVLLAAPEVAMGPVPGPPPGPDGSWRRPGRVLDNAALIACGEGALRLRVLQRAGKAALPAEVLLRGFPLAVGAVLE